MRFRPCRFILLLFCLELVALSGYGKHIKGGEIHYTYLGPSTTTPNADRYEIRLRLFISCQSTLGQLESIR